MTVDSGEWRDLLKSYVECWQVLVSSLVCLVMSWQEVENRDIWRSVGDIDADTGVDVGVGIFTCRNRSRTIRQLLKSS